MATTPLLNPVSVKILRAKFKLNKGDVIPINIDGKKTTARVNLADSTYDSQRTATLTSGQGIMVNLTRFSAAGWTGSLTSENRVRLHRQFPQFTKPMIVGSPMQFMRDGDKAGQALTANA